MNRRILSIVFILSSFIYRAPLYAQSDTIKIMQYNLLSFGPPCGSVNINDKYDRLGVILEHVQPDIMAVNEIGPNTVLGNGIIQLSYDYTNLIEQGDLTNQANSNFANQIFYRTDKFGYVGTEVISGAIRDINVYTFYHLPSAQMGGDTTFFRCIVGHFKAGNSNADRGQRTNAANSIINWIAQNGTDQNILVMGDFNIGEASEAAFQALINPGDPATRLLDPINKQAGWSGASNAVFHTQSTRSSNIDCGAAGGLDDRFDMILVNESVLNGTHGMSYVQGSYEAVGNDGSSYNDELNCFNNTSVPTNVCTTLRLMSDHLPVIAEFSFDVSTGIREQLIPGLEVEVVPQPFGEEFAITLTHNERTIDTYQFRLYDLLGQVVFPAQNIPINERVSFPTSSLSSGLYMMEIQDQKGRVIRKKVLKE